jgi:acyl-CoA thioester hydrolase
MVDSAAPASAFHWRIRVYYEDTDVGGVVYHANYLRYLERARTEWLRHHGVVQSRLLAERGLQFVIVAMELRFIAPARLDDALHSTVDQCERRGASLRFSQQLLRPADNAVLVTANSRAALLDATTFRPRPIPEDLLPE